MTVGEDSWLRYSPDGRRLLIAGRSGGIYTWDLDPSEHMASNVGLFDLGGGSDAFGQAMIDYVDGGPAVLDEVLARIDTLSD